MTGDALVFLNGQEHMHGAALIGNENGTVLGHLLGFIDIQVEFPMGDGQVHEFSCVSRFCK